MGKALGWYQHPCVGVHDYNSQQGETFKYLFILIVHSNSKHGCALICEKTTHPCEKLAPVLSDSLSQSSDVTKGANGELAKLSRSLRQKGK